jgi:S-DNA-T family DNA segregation ATPase FtsK/SpoIIIE
LIIQLLPGQLIADIAAVGSRLARALGVRRLKLSARGTAWVRVDLLNDDPLEAIVPMPRYESGPVLIGIDENGTTIAREPIGMTHLVVQGATGSGKSIWTYGLLSQLARRPDVLVAGCDPSGLLFRPFAGSRHADWQASGVADPEAFGKVLRRLVDEMDQRILELPDDRDQVETGPELPVVVVLLEEIAGMYRVCDQQGKDLGKLVRSLIGRLLAEGRKAGIRVVMIVQRAEATLIGAFERAQCSMRISFGTDSLESVRLLHPAASAAVAEEHFAAPPGIALLTAPGLPLTRFRAPFVGEYADYTDVVRAACRAGPDD